MSSYGQVFLVYFIDAFGNGKSLGELPRFGHYACNGHYGRVFVICFLDSVDNGKGLGELARFASVHLQCSLRLRPFQ